MKKALLKLSLFELKKSLFHDLNWLSNGLFLLVNLTMFPFTINPDPETLNQLCLSAIMTSMLLGIVLTTNHIFDEDIKDGSLDQYLTFGLATHIIYLSRVIAVSIEFILIIIIVLPCMSLLYAVPLNIILKITLMMILSTPLLTSSSIFGSMLTMNLRRNSAISILLIFPLLISALITLSLAADKILTTSLLNSSLIYIEINLGLSLLLIPILAWISNYLIKFNK